MSAKNNRGKVFFIKDKSGREISRIRIPDDPAILIRRCQQAKTDLDRSVFAELKGIDIAADGSADAEYAEILRSAETEVHSVFDGLFGKRTGKRLFRTTRPFAAVGGRFFCAVMLDAIASGVRAEINKEIGEKHDER